MRYRHLWTEGDAARMQLIPALAPWVYSASRPFADWYFGDPDVAAEILHEWMSRPTAEVFVGRAIVMMGPETESETAGCLIALSGADLAKARAADFAAFCHELGSGPESEEVVAQVVPASRELFPAGGGRRALHQPGGGGSLAPRSGPRAKAGGPHHGDVPGRRASGKFRLDVSADNRAAIRAYQAAGLESGQHQPQPDVRAHVLRDGHCGRNSRVTSTPS